MKYDVIVGNPPFQNKEKRNTTPHKVWIEFTHQAFAQLEDNGALLWISPASWGSPSNKVFKYFCNYQVESVNFDTAEYFPGIGSTFSNYLIYNTSTMQQPTVITKSGKTFTATLDESVKYLANDFCELSFNIHKKVMFDSTQKLDINYDYVTCHNVIRHALKLHDKKIARAHQAVEKAKTDKALKRAEARLENLMATRDNVQITISEEQTSTHTFPILHTNNKIWYSSVKQDFADKKKVLWSRSGYTKPFYDDGNYGCTDLCYYVLVDNDQEGEALTQNLNSDLFKYIFATARWSGFGNDKVFKMVPDLKTLAPLTNTQMYEKYNITTAEQKYIAQYLYGKVNGRPRKSAKTSQTKTQERIDNLGEVFTPEELVKKMIATLPSEKWAPNVTFIDPACGIGYFLVEVIKEKIKYGLSPEQAISTTYGVDIMEDNVLECRRRINELTNYAHPALVETQITPGDFLKNE